MKRLPKCIILLICLFLFVFPVAVNAASTDGFSISGVSKSNASVTATISCPEGMGTAICAIYDDSGRMVGIDSTSVSGIKKCSFSFAISSFADAKVFLVDAIGRPLCESISLSYEEPPTLEYVIEPYYQSITVGLSSSFDVNIYSNYEGMGTYRYYSEDDNIASCEWGEWTDHYNIPLSISSHAIGTTIVHLSLMDENDNVLATNTINVTAVDLAFNDSFYLSSSSSTLYPGESITIDLFQNISADPLALLYNFDTSVSSCAWGDWDSTATWIPLTITGINPGYSNIVIDFYDEGNYCGSKVLEIHVLQPGALTLSDTTLVLNEGYSSTILVAHNCEDAITVYYSIGDDTIVSCNWGDWIDYYTLPLTIIGINSGITTVRVDLVDQNDILLDTQFIGVYVRNASYDPPTTGISFPLHLYSNDGKVYLGKLVTNQYDSDSIYNEYGTYGSKYSQKSIWNEYGTYGGNYSSESAFNEYATKPPIIVDNNGKFFGYLTANELKANGYTITELRQYLVNNGQ